jgi:hypothetical protein
MGIASYAKLADVLGKSDIGDKYMQIAKEMATEWEKMANDGDHYRLTFDRPGTWSQKYNLVWDRLLGFNVFDPQIIEKEMAYYKTLQNEYGLPLDNRATYTKTDWIMWTATLTGDRNDFDTLIDYIYKYANDTITAERMNFKARSVVGGYYMKLLEDKIKTGNK